MSAASKPVSWVALTVLAAATFSVGCGSEPAAQPCDLPALQHSAVSQTNRADSTASARQSIEPTSSGSQTPAQVSTADLERGIIGWAREIKDIDTAEVDELEGKACESGQRLSDEQQHHYQDLLAQLRHALVVYERSRVSEEDAREFYQANPERFRQQGTVRVKITPWEGKRALAPKEITIDATTVRQVQEGSDDIVSAALELEPGQLVTVTDRAGNQSQVECLSKELGELVPFEEVMQAAAQQLAQERVEEQIWQRAKAVKVVP